jgi:gas vesicle protein
MNNQSNGFWLFLAGAAVGLAVGYFLAAENKEEIAGTIKDKINKVKDDLEGDIEKGKKIVDDLRRTANDFLKNA